MPEAPGEKLVTFRPTALYVFVVIGHLWNEETPPPFLIVSRK